MGYARFNENGASNGTSLLYRMKPVPITTQLYGQGVVSNNFNLPVVRSGAGDKSFSISGGTGIILDTTNSAGVSTATATITYTTYLTGSVIVGAHLNSTDQCLYVLLYASPSWQFIKINDSTGVVTTIGTAFTPTTPANWPTSPSSGYASMEVDSVSGHLKLVFNGVYHLVNKSSGAIVTQNTAITLGSFLARRVFYVTQDGAVGVSVDSGSTTTGTTTLPSTVHSTYGHISSYLVAVSDAGQIISAGANSSALNSTTTLLVDNDKVLFINIGNQSPVGAKLFLRTDFDKFIKSIAELGAGVL